MRRNPHFEFRRRTRLVNPKLQGGAAIPLIAVVTAAGTLSGVLLFTDIRQAMMDAAIGGHYRFSTPFQIVNGILAWHLLALFSIVFGGGSLAFLWYVRRVRSEISRMTDSFDAAVQGDLSSPAKVRGFRGLSDFGREIDEIRSHTLGQVEEVRREAQAMRRSGMSQTEFENRWEALKETIGRIVP